MDISWWQAAVLGVVEGLTEFLPISSTGHLVAAEPLIGAKDSHDVFTVVIQLGAILAVCIYFHRRLWQLLRGALARDPAALRFIGLVGLATLPAVIGLPLNKWIEEHLFSVPMVACSFVWGGLAILLIERRRAAPVHTEAAALPWRVALGIGLCQLVAFIPGVSRSGATILGAVCLGVARPAATEFSFFMAMPVLAGASLLKLRKYHQEIGRDDAVAIAVGFVVAFAVALAVVHWLLRYVAGHDFRPFAWYRIAAGAALAGLLAAGVLA
jgi:undecaprenyl-diphosphatase